MGSLGDDIASLCRRHCAIRHEVGRSDWEKEAADDSKCEAELVDVADTLKRAISERMKVRSTVKCFQTASVFRVIEGHSCSFARPRVTPKGLRVLWCEGGVNGLCCSV